MAVLLLVAVAWIYVVLMMSVAEATAPQGTLIGALFTFVLYGALPLSIVLYIGATPLRRRARLERERRAASDAERIDPDHGGHAPGNAGVAPERKEP